MKVLNVYIIHSTYLENRIKYVNSTVGFLSKKAEDIGLKINVNIIKEPTFEFVESNIKTFNDRVNYDHEKDVEFDKTISSLNTKQISNIEKHRELMNHISNEDELHFVIEDDVLVGEAYINNIIELLQKMKDDTFVDWDILFTCMSIQDNEDTLKMIDSRTQYKIFNGKSSYFIRPCIAKELKNFLNIFKYDLKTSISKFVWDKKEIRSMVLNKHTFLEGSKIGLMSTSNRPCNFLFQNTDFIKLSKISTNDNLSKELMKEAEQIFEKIKDTKSPDIFHIMGLIYFKANEFKQAQMFMKNACIYLEDSNGYVGKSSEILNNAINMYQYDQEKLEEYKNKKSKYT